MNENQSVSGQFLELYKRQSYDRTLHAWMAQFTCWLSPATLNLALTDWLSHLAGSPAKQTDIIESAMQKFTQAFLYWYKSHWQNGSDALIACPPNDHRFQNEAWQKFPFNFYHQTFLLYEQLWDEVTSCISGISAHHEKVVNFTVRQLLDMFSPSNLPVTNPEVIAATLEQNGGNFLNGFNNFIDDISRKISGLPPAGTEQFRVGENLALTKGKVIFRNNLIELIQYEPTTQKVSAEPILFVPAWIMKYYILDLSSHNSMVKYLVDQGHTVFMISWKNPTSADRNLGLVDYVNLGIMDALEAINYLVPNQKIHAVGYCIGGTLLMLAAAAMAKKSDERLKTITLFAAQVDFKDAGEILLFVDESQVTYLEDIMWEKGYLDGSQMAGAFSLIRSIDFIWSRVISDYLLGKREPLFDLMAWDYDTTRLPYKMHSEYLRKLFLNNDLVEGRFKIDNKNLALIDIKVPMFVVSTATDHVAPWQSVYKIHFFTESEITFILTTGGHNTGVVSEPGHPGRSFQIMTQHEGETRISSDNWQEQAPREEGSWWPAWEKWLSSYSAKEKIAPPSLGNPKKGYKLLCDAPGTYILQK